jgi:hypothetical protein
MTKASGTVTDSPSTYRIDAALFAEIGLVVVGDVNAISPRRRARIDNRNM